MCFIIKVSEKLLDKNKFACSKIILWIHYSWMYNGKPTFSKKSCLQQITHPTPPPPSEVKWMSPKCVQTSFMKRTFCGLILARDISNKQPHYLIILVVFLREV